MQIWWKIIRSQALRRDSVSEHNANIIGARQARSLAVAQPRSHSARYGATAIKETMPRNPTIYRPDIDGLRALAVLAVVLFHYRVPGFGGGFVGVDVFFVISGFLITGFILKEM